MTWRKLFDKYDIRITTWMRNHGLRFLRYSLAVIFIWFGLLKPLGLSPATPLVFQTSFLFSPYTFMFIVGWWEVLICICLLFRPLIRVGLFLLFVHMIGTFLPLFLVPEAVWVKFPFILTLEGQYIIKNLVLISAGLVVGGSVRRKRLL